MGRLFSFRGRIPRRRFWLFLAMAVPLLAALLAGFWAYALSVPGAYENGGPTPFPTDPVWIAAAVVFFLMLALILIGTAATVVKRLHDRDKAWWWLLIFLILPGPFDGAGMVLLQTGGSEEIATVLRLAAMALYAWGLVELGLLPGTDGENRFGADPRTPH